MINRRFISTILAFLLVFSISVNDFMLVHASAEELEHETQVYSWALNGGNVTITYSVQNDTVVEECIFVENSVTVAAIRRVVAPNGVISVYHNGAFQYSANTDYSVFLAMVQNGIDLHSQNADSTGIGRTIYQVCGSTLYHELVSTNAETINTIASGIVGVGAMGIAQILMTSFVWLSPYVGIIATAVTIYDIINSTPCEYIDITEYKYFVHDYSTNQSKNCFHTYLVFYNITSSGTRQVVDARWECSEVIL